MKAYTRSISFQDERRDIEEIWDGQLTAHDIEAELQRALCLRDHCRRLQRAFREWEKVKTQRAIEEKMQFQIGDIIQGTGKCRPLLVTERDVGSGNVPYYTGFQIVAGKLTAGRGRILDFNGGKTITLLGRPRNLVWTPSRTSPLRATLPALDKSETGTSSREAAKEAKG